MMNNDDSSSMMQDKNRRLSEAQEWCFRLMKDPNQFEKWRYIDSIEYNVYSNIIEQFQKLYEKTTAADRSALAKIINGMKQQKENQEVNVSTFLFVYPIEDCCTRPVMRFISCEIAAISV